MKDLRIIKNVVLWLTSLSPSVSNSSNRIVLKCSSHTARLSSRAIFSSSINAPFLSSTRSLWLDSSFSRSATKSEWSKIIQVRAEDNLYKQAIILLQLYWNTLDFLAHLFWVYDIQYHWILWNMSRTCLGLCLTSSLKELHYILL